MSSYISARAKAFMNRLRILQETRVTIDLVEGVDEITLADDVTVLGVEDDGMVSFFSDDQGTIAVFAGDIRRIEYDPDVDEDEEDH